MSARYWMYVPSAPPPELPEALALGAIAPETTEAEWMKLSPGMRREIVRSARRAKARAEAERFVADDEWASSGGFPEG